MPLHTFEELGFRLHYILHFYLWPLPVRWKKDYSGMEITKPYSKWVPFVCMTAYLFTLGVLCFYVAIKYTYITTIPEFKTINCLILFVFGGCALSIVLLTVRAAPCLEGMVGFINQLLKTSDDLLAGKLI